MKRSRHSCRGFNLVETLVATLILSATVVTVGALSTRAMTSCRLNRERVRASLLADRILARIEAMGVTQFLEQDQLQGDFGDLAPGVQWQVTHKFMEIDQLYQLTVTVVWAEHGRARSYTVMTMLNGNRSLPPDQSHETTQRS